MTFNNVNGCFPHQDDENTEKHKLGPYIETTMKMPRDPDLHEAHIPGYPLHRSDEQRRKFESHHLRPVLLPLDELRELRTLALPLLGREKTVEGKRGGGREDKGDVS